MADTSLVDALVGFQDDGTGVSDGSEDFTSAAYFSLLSKYKGQGSYVGEDTAGNATLQFANVDTTNDQVDIEPGFAYVMESGKSVQSSAQSTYDAILPNDVPYVVVLRDELALENLDLATDTVNDVWLAIDPTAQDSVYIRHGSGLTAPTDPSVKLGTVDTSTGATTRPNDLAKGAFDALTANSTTTDSVDGGVTSTAITDFEGDNLSVGVDGVLDATSGGGQTTALVDSASTTTYTTSDEDVVYVDTGSAAVTVTLASADATQGNEIRVVNITGTNPVTVDTEGTETIDPNAEASKSWSKEGWGISFTSDGTNWDTTLSATYESVQTTAELTDPAGVTHTGELADASDVGGGFLTEDGNSPQTDAGTTSATFTFADTYDIWVVYLQIEAQTSNATTVDLRANGDTGNNYSYTVNSDARTNSVSEVSNIIQITGNELATLKFDCAGRFASTWTGGKHVYRNSQGQAVGWTNLNITSPLTSLTLLADNSIDVSWVVLGGDINSGGPP